MTSISIENMNSDRYAIPLVDSVINFIPEIKRGGKPIATEGFKMATGGDQMMAWRMWHGQVFFKPNASQVININDWPVLDSAGEEIRRRLGYFIVEFKKNQEEDVENIGDMIVDRELPGVLAWAIEGIKDYFQNGYNSDYSLALFSQWTNSFDPVTLFLSECCSREGRVLTSAVYKVFDRFCEENGYFVVRKGQFFANLENLFGPKKEIDGRYFFSGLSLNETGRQIAETLGLTAARTAGWVERKPGRMK